MISYDDKGGIKIQDTRRDFDWIIDESHDPGGYSRLHRKARTKGCNFRVFVQQNDITSPAITAKAEQFRQGHRGSCNFSRQTGEMSGLGPQHSGSERNTYFPHQRS